MARAAINTGRLRRRVRQRLVDGDGGADGFKKARVGRGAAALRERRRRVTTGAHR